MRKDISHAWKKWLLIRDVKDMDVVEEAKTSFEAGWLARELSTKSKIEELTMKYVPKNDNEKASNKDVKLT